MSSSHSVFLFISFSQINVKMDCVQTAGFVHLWVNDFCMFSKYFCKKGRNEVEMCIPVRCLLPKDVSLLNPAVILQQSNAELHP